MTFGPGLRIGDDGCPGTVMDGNQDGIPPEKAVVHVGVKAATEAACLANHQAPPFVQIPPAGTVQTVSVKGGAWLTTAPGPPGMPRKWKGAHSPLRHQLLSSSPTTQVSSIARAMAPASSVSGDDHSVRKAARPVSRKLSSGQGTTSICLRFHVRQPVAG